jgi:hypothetical protein
MVKLKWKVATKPTGSFAWVHKRAWPSAEYPNGSTAAFIRCSDSYTPARSRGEDTHAALEIWIANHDGTNFQNVRLKTRGSTLKEAKELVTKFLENNPRFRHRDYRN